MSDFATDAAALEVTVQGLVSDVATVKSQLAALVIPPAIDLTQINADIAALQARLGTDETALAADESAESAAAAAIAALQKALASGGGTGGAAVRGILTATINASGHLVFGMTDGSSIDAGALPAGSGAGGGSGGGPVIPPDQNVYPLTMEPVANPGDPVTLGVGPDQVEILIANNPNNVANPTTFAVLMDGKAIAGPLLVTSNVGETSTGSQLFTIKGSWGPLPRTVSIVGAGAGLSDYFLNAISYDFTPLVFNGVADSRGGKTTNGTTVYNSARVPTDWTLPVAVTPVAPPPPAPDQTVIAGATINGSAALSLVLSDLIAALPADGTLALPAGTLAEAGIALPLGTLAGAGLGKTIIDATNQSLYQNKAAIVPQAPGTVIQDLSITGARVSDVLGGNGAGIRDNDNGIGINLQRVESYGNDNGLLVFAADHLLTDTYFHDNGAPVGSSARGFTHNAYFNGTPTTTVTLVNHRSENAQGGHEVKSRAGTTIATAPKIITGGNGSCFDQPDGGVLKIDGGDLTLPAGAADENFITFSMESTNNAAAGQKCAATNTVFRDGTGTGGIIQSGDPNATLDVTGSTYTGTVAPQIRGFASITGTITQAPA